MESLVTTQWLAENLEEPHLAIMDSTFFLPDAGRNARKEFREAHIPGARFLDIIQLADRSNPAPHMLPPFGRFSDAMNRLGVSNLEDRIVVYDNSPLRSAARGWFMLRCFGARRVAILDGGFQKWAAEGRLTESGSPRPRCATWCFQPERRNVITKEALLKGTTPPIVDARSKARFAGTEVEPRPLVAAGHIPGSRNLPFAELYNADGTFKPKEELRQLFASAGIDPAKPFVATCGSGVTANSLIFAAHLLGHDTGRLYDGSWSEWGADPATPKALGPV